MSPSSERTPHTSRHDEDATTVESLRDSDAYPPLAPAPMDKPSPVGDTCPDRASQRSSCRSARASSSSEDAPDDDELSEDGTYKGEPSLLGEALPPDGDGEMLFQTNVTAVLSAFMSGGDATRVLATLSQ